MNIDWIFIAFCAFCAFVHIECIRGGRDAKPGEFPYQVLIRNRALNSRCGGGILNDNYILTAAYCVWAAQPKELYVRGGITALFENGTVIDINQITMHPTYDMISSVNNIALLRTAKRIEFTNCIEPIDMSPFTVAEQDSNVTVVGWGLNGEVHLLKSCICESFSASVFCCTKLHHLMR